MSADLPPGRESRRQRRACFADRLTTSAEEEPLFAVLFEVHPKPDRWDAYLGIAGMLRPELEQIDGFVDNVRYRSLGRSLAASCALS